MQFTGILTQRLMESELENIEVLNMYGCSYSSFYIVVPFFFSSVFRFTE